MDNKQKKKILKTIYKTLLLFILLSVGWTCYLAIDKLIAKKSAILWLDIALIVVCALIVIFALAELSKTKHIKNKFGLAKYLYAITFLSFVGVIVLGFVFYYTELTVQNGYLFAIALILASEVLSVVMFIVGLKLAKLYSNTTITIDSTAEVPNYDDELLMKKKLDEMTRKLEMKRVQEKIDAIQKELDDK